MCTLSINGLDKKNYTLCMKKNTTIEDVKNEFLRQFKAEGIILKKILNLDKVEFEALREKSENQRFKKVKDMSDDVVSFRAFVAFKNNLSNHWQSQDSQREREKELNALKFFIRDLKHQAASLKGLDGTQVIVDSIRSFETKFNELIKPIEKSIQVPNHDNNKSIKCKISEKNIDYHFCLEQNTHYQLHLLAGSQELSDDKPLDILIGHVAEITLVINRCPLKRNPNTGGNVDVNLAGCSSTVFSSAQSRGGDECSTSVGWSSKILPAHSAQQPVAAFSRATSSNSKPAPNQHTSGDPKIPNESKKVDIKKADENGISECILN